MTDFVLRGGLIVTMDPARRVLHGDLLVRGGRIVALGDISVAEADGAQVVDARTWAVTPGLVQTHVHLCQTLLRNRADDLRLLEWLKGRVWPMEAAHDAESLAAACDVALAELIGGGTTTILDMGTVGHQDTVFERLAAWGMRAFAGKAMMDTGADVPAGLRETTAASLAESDALCNRWDGAERGRLHYAYAPRFALSCTDELLRAVARTARNRGAIVHTHASEQEDECKIVEIARGESNIAYLRSTGIHGARTVLAHCVHATPREKDLLAADGTRVAHCPSANLKLGSGIAPIADYLGRGIHVGLGADGAPCNNRLDGWEELRLAALLSKTVAGPQSLPAAEAFALATVRGAEALGIGGEVGSLAVGKRADVIAVDLSGAHHLPGGDPYAQLVYCARATDVRFVAIDGEIKVAGGVLRAPAGCAAGDLADRARREADKLVARAGLE